MTVIKEMMQLESLQHLLAGIIPGAQLERTRLPACSQVGQYEGCTTPDLDEAAAFIRCAPGLRELKVTLERVCLIPPVLLVILQAIPIAETSPA